MGYKYLKLSQSRPQVLSTCCFLFSKHSSPKCAPVSIHHLHPVFAQISPSQDAFHNHTTWLLPLTPHHSLVLFLFFIFPLHLSFSCHIFHLSYLLFLTLISPSQYPSGKQSPRRAEISLFFFSVCNPALITVSGTLQVLNNIWGMNDK